MTPTYSIKVISADRLTVQEDNSQLLSVLFEIRRGDELVKALRQGFDITATEDDINLELSNVLVTFLSDAQQAEVNAESDRINEAADVTIEAIKDLNITVDEATKNVSDAGEEIINKE